MKNLFDPFLSVSWASSGKDSGGAPQLKGARWFSYEELKRITNNFSMSSELGYGGYGKVCGLIKTLKDHFLKLDK